MPGPVGKAEFFLNVPGNDIGAIGAGAANAADKFGKVMQAN